MSANLGEHMANTNKKRPRESLDISKYDLITDLAKNKQDWKLKVRVVRMWDNITWLKKFFMGIDVILADETGNAIQASINRDDAPHYKEKLKEGHILLCAVDVIGRLKKPGKLEEIWGRKGKVLRRVIDIELNSGDVLNITLWSNVAKIFSDHLNFDTTKTNVVILTSLTTKTFNGNITMGSTDQTRIYGDINLPQIKEYIEGIDTANSNFELDTYGASEDIENPLTLTIKELTELIYASNVADGTKVICKSTITRINTTRPWYFTSCPSCRKKLIYEDGEKICRFCKNPADIPITRYRVEFEVEDHTGNNTFVLLDRLAESLIQVPVTTFLSDNSEDGIPELLPEPIGKLVGETHVFEVKLNKSFDQYRLDTALDLYPVYEELARGGMLPQGDWTHPSYFVPPVGGYPQPARRPPPTTTAGASTSRRATAAAAEADEGSDSGSGVDSDSDYDGGD
ncbi:uncharacterized protein LOC141620104 [Silene latifolia]|uniref:uncharacterized protein LOC141620104 n=1 Tax=Silene latifolia TaxID=37657 RepID=UPI003D780140